MEKKQIIHSNSSNTINKILAQYVLDDLLILNEIYEFLQKKNLYIEFLEFLDSDLRKKFESCLKNKLDKTNLYI